jgi:hypothetical protein
MWFILESLPAMPLPALNEAGERLVEGLLPTDKSCKGPPRWVNPSAFPAKITTAISKTTDVARYI